METTASTEADAVAADPAENDQGGNQPTPLHDEASFKSTLEEHHSLAATSAAARPLALQQDSAGVGLAAGDPSLGPLPLIQDPEEKQESFKLFIGGLPSIMSNEQLAEQFSQYGEVIDAVVIRDHRTQQSRGFGFVSFADLKSYLAGLKADVRVGNRRLECKPALSKRQIRTKNISDFGGGNNRKVFVGGITPKTNDELLMQYFGRFGLVSAAMVMKNMVTGKSRGFAFVYFADEAIAELVCSFQHKIDGKRVDCMPALPKQVFSQQGMASGQYKNPRRSNNPGRSHQRQPYQQLASYGEAENPEMNALMMTLNNLVVSNQYQQMNGGMAQQRPFASSPQMYHMGGMNGGMGGMGGMMNGMVNPNGSPMFHPMSPMQGSVDPRFFNPQFSLQPQQQFVDAGQAVANKRLPPDVLATVLRKQAYQKIGNKADAALQNGDKSTN